MVIVVAMLKSNLERIPKQNVYMHIKKKPYPTLLGWPTCAGSYEKFSSNLGGIPAKSSEIPPRWTSSLLI